MRILLVYPRYPDTFWSFKHAVKFISKKAAFPPLGLITVASLIPKEYDVKLIDMNIETLQDKDITNSDFVFISAMSVQSQSAIQVIKKCNDLNVKIVAGGPLFTSSFEMFDMVDHLVLDEAEITLPKFFEDLEKGCPQKIYRAGAWADITTTPLPSWQYAKMKLYSSMNIQYSRGCPFDCDFCDITVLYGRRPRTKTKEQVVAELDNLKNAGWKGPVFFVDDNFIGNKNKLKKEILPAIAEWMKKNNHPFWFNTEASINMADDGELMRLMVAAGFEAVFIGIETPLEESLTECNKIQNKNRDLISSVKKIQSFGLDVQGGFIVGFDNDPSTIFDKVTSFIQESGIVTAMVGLLNAPKGTKLHKRMIAEGRMLEDFNGNNTDLSINFIPKMDLNILLDGYRSIIKNLYTPKEYYKRLHHFLKEFEHKGEVSFHFQFRYLQGLFLSMLKLGMIGKERIYFWKLFFWTLIRKPKLFSLYILYAIYGFHFRKIFEV
ncbi:MAG TPA: DUF4070 domain-containing protein [Ignavibacteriaceae bacterium]|nr:DUF4070 domain-containing protein [Ignavibacteriaceae bacterium]